jgi:hypothetical protein
MYVSEASVMLLLAAAAASSLLLVLIWHLGFRPRLRRPSHGDATAPPRPALDEKSPLHDAEIPDEAAGAPPPPPYLPASVTASEPDTIGRDQWVLRMTRHVFGERHGGRYNVLVINDDLQYHFTPAGVVEEFRVMYRDGRRTVPYRIVAFTRGELLNLGDGGDINWDWMGNFVRHNNSQLSFRPCQPGRNYQQDPWIAAAKSG